MVFRFIFILSFSACVLFSQSIFDKFSMFGELNKKSGASPYNELVGGFLIDKTLVIQNSAMVYASLYLKSFNKNNGDNRLIIKPRELYARFNVDGFNVSVGKEIVDLSTAKIYSINTFLSPITSILDPLDKALIYEGLNVATISRVVNGAKVLLYIYQNEGFVLNALAKASYNINEADVSFLMGFDKTSEFFISSGLFFRINQNSNIYIEAKHQNDKQNYVVGADHTLHNGVAIAIERIVKNQEFFDNNAVIENGILKEFSIANGVEHLGDIGNLSSSNYFSVYARVPYNNVAINSFLGLYNMDDESKMLVLQHDYKLSVAKLTAKFVKNIGSGDESEFGKRASTTFMAHVSFALL